MSLLQHSVRVFLRYSFRSDKHVEAQVRVVLATFTACQDKCTETNVALFAYTIVRESQWILQGPSVKGAITLIIPREPTGSTLDVPSVQGFQRAIDYLI